MESLVMLAEFYSGKTVLVTGNTGFKGAWLTIWLHKLGARVIGYSLKPPTTPSLYETCGLRLKTETIDGDIRDTSRVREVIGRFRPDFVFHLAAAPIVRKSYESPAETFDVNVMGTLSTLEAVRLERHPCTIVVVSTDKCYENRESDGGYRETDRLGGDDPYGASKAAMEIAVAAYRKSFFAPEKIDCHGVRLATARAGNVIGGGDWSEDRIVPDAMRSLSRGERLGVRNPASVRPWQHVLEPLSGYLWLGAKLFGAGGEGYAAGWNFGPSSADVKTVAQLADLLVSEWGEGSWHATPEANAPHETSVLVLSSEKARLELGWLPVWDLNTAVTRTVGWYREYYSNPSNSAALYQKCAEDILAYECAAIQKVAACTS